MKLLVTGGAGYIGSHTCVELLNAGYDMVSRPGDAPFSYANATKVKRELGWTAQLDMDRMCQDAWRFIQKNPDGIC